MAVYKTEAVVVSQEKSLQEIYLSDRRDNHWVAEDSHMPGGGAGQECIV